MKTEFTQKEKEFLNRKKPNNSKIKIVAIAIVSLLILGLIIDAFNGFCIFRNAKSLTWGIGGLFLVSLFYIIGEFGSDWINSKDDISHPLYKRAFHLLLLLCFAGLIMAVCWFVLKKLG